MIYPSVLPSAHTTAHPSGLNHFNCISHHKLNRFCRVTGSLLALQIGHVQMTQTDANSPSWEGSSSKCIGLSGSGTFFWLSRRKQGLGIMLCPSRRRLPRFQVSIEHVVLINYEGVVHHTQQPEEELDRISCKSFHAVSSGFRERDI